MKLRRRIANILIRSAEILQRYDDNAQVFRDILGVRRMHIKGDKTICMLHDDLEWRISALEQSTKT